MASQKESITSETKKETEGVATSPVQKVILTRLEELPLSTRMKYGLTGRAVIEVSINSPMTRNVKKIGGTYTDYFEEKFKQSSLTPEQIRKLADDF